MAIEIPEVQVIDVPPSYADSHIDAVLGVPSGTLRKSEEMTRLR